MLYVCVSIKKTKIIKGTSKNNCIHSIIKTARKRSLKYTYNDTKILYVIVYVRYNNKMDCTCFFSFFFYESKSIPSIRKCLRNGFRKDNGKLLFSRLYSSFIATTKVRLLTVHRSKS